MQLLEQKGEVVLPVTPLKPLLLVPTVWLLEGDDARQPRDEEAATIPVVTVW